MVILILGRSANDYLRYLNIAQFILKIGRNVNDLNFGSVTELFIHIFHEPRKLVNT